ncbi:hypothetical protein EYM_05105 [Ignicoccus islandicus DSM 13165]|uniref:Transglutaminase-like domain-containing protein n=1 Tax=Ignicoccus islandicus DSM 13165 TaxID=940295 RepID=A0A0U3E3R3_9CREN|nr:transglutaminase-like domain-containing protein [Ignicoccus islandicus]ALU12555.1 hypothetical protein EYM_05105 [Ignicoccus islandicus DSM 13165]
MIKLVVALLVSMTLAYLGTAFVKPVSSGAIASGNVLEIPFSWDARSHSTVLAVVSPPHAKYLRVASFDKYQDGKWVRTGGSFDALRQGGEEFTVAITPFSVFLYPAFPVPQPAPGWAPSVVNGRLSGDTVTTSAMRLKVKVVYSDPYPYEEFPALSVTVNSILGEKAQWSTPRVINLANELLEKFRYRPLRALLNYLTNWLRGDYQYSLYYSGAPGGDPVDWFLFQSKVGMCVHFASAAAVLLNDMGIKARVVYGYAVSYINGNVRTFVTPTHLWVEVWVPGYGWVPWDPSPPQAIELGSPQVIAPTGGVQPPSQGTQVRTPLGSKGPGEVNWNLSGAFTNVLIAAGGLAVTYMTLRDFIADWIFRWPVAFRKCVERKIGKRGLTLREVAEITGIEELKEAQLKYLREGKWIRKGIWKALKWCLRR